MKRIVSFEPRCPMAISCEQTLVEAWRQVLIENADTVVLGIERYPIRLTPKPRLSGCEFLITEHRFCWGLDFYKGMIRSRMTIRARYGQRSECESK